MNILKFFWRNLIPLYVRMQLRNFYILSILQGQKRSIREKRSINQNGEPIPWLTYPAIEYINQYNLNEMSIFEFGCGNSSLFWAKRAKKVISIENDINWFMYVKKYINCNHDIYLKKDKGSYVNMLQELNLKYDIIIVDGEWRSACVEKAVDYLEEGGMIIIDNSDWYPDSNNFLRSRGFFQIDFNGFGPINNICWTTSIFIKANNRIQNTFSNPVPMGGIKKYCDEEIQGIHES